MSLEDKDKRHAHTNNSRLTSNPTIGVNQPDGKQRVDELTLTNEHVLIDRFHCHTMKKGNQKGIQWMKSRNCDVIGNKEKKHFSKFYV